MTFFFWYEIAETACRIREHTGNERWRSLDNCAVFLFNAKMIGFLLWKNLNSLHKISHRTKKSFFFNGYLAHSFRKKSGGYNVNKILIIDFAYIYGSDDCVFECTDSALGWAGYSQRTRQVINRTKWYKAKGRAALYRNHTINDFVNGPIAAYADYISILFGRLTCKIAGITGLVS